jgi:hypothetical protein
LEKEVADMYDSCYTSDKTEAFLFAKLISKLRYVENVKVDATKKTEYYVGFKITTDSPEVYKEIANLVRENNLLSINFYGEDWIQAFNT